MKEIYKEALGLIDLTSLNVTDNPSKIGDMVRKVNGFHSVYPQYPLPASICVYPNFAKVIKAVKTEPDVRITVVGGCFPASQSPLEVKILECTTAVAEGADEVDIVLALNAFLEGRYDEAQREIVEIGKAIRAVNTDVHLKVILETGALKEPKLIEDASWLSMEAGADFIKTSTGKIGIGATLEAAEVMLKCIEKNVKINKKTVGFKAAGGISTPEEALAYAEKAKKILGDKFVNNQTFRIGASRLTDRLHSILT
jgi:deoxyribose-phosphate aldolase